MKLNLTSLRCRIGPALAVSCGLLVLLPAITWAQTYPLSVYTRFSGGPNGTVSVEPLDYTCVNPPFPGDCVYDIASGTQLTLIASAPAGAAFINWFDNGGSTIGTSPTLNLTMNGAKTAQANFQNSPGPYALIVYKGVPGLGNGSVSGPAGLFCGTNDGSCSQNFSSGTVVTLTNTPALGWSFGYWEIGGVYYSNSTITLTVDGDKVVQAIFVYHDLPPVVNIVAPTNNASVWACTYFALTASASDPDGWVAKLEFFLGGTNGAKLGEQTFGLAANGAPVTASVLWATNVLGAANTFTVRATDNSGSQTVSSPVTVTTALPPLNYLIAYGLTTNRECEFCLNGQAGHLYSLLATTNFITWTNLGNMQNVNGLLKFLDPASTTIPYRFYRAQEQ